MVNGVKAHPDNKDGDGNIVLPFSGSAALSGGDIAAFYNGVFDAIDSGTIVLDLSACTTAMFGSPGTDNDVFPNSRRARIVKITLPPGFTVVNGGSHTFYHFSGLKEVVFTGTGLTSIPRFAFWYCTSLTSIVIPASVTSIAEGAFMNCGLTSIVIPASVTSIGDSAFSYSALTSIVIPASVTSIGDHAFNYSALAGVTFLQAAPPTLGTDSFSGTNITAVHVLSGRLEAYTITPGTAIADQEGLPAAASWVGDAVAP
jgi:hypothetical protein